jgi:hypothetical protein
VGLDEEVIESLLSASGCCMHVRPGMRFWEGVWILQRPGDTSIFSFFVNQVLSTLGDGLDCEATTFLAVASEPQVLGCLDFTTHWLSY